MPQASTAAGGDKGAQASTTPLQRAVFAGVGRETLNQQTDGTSPNNQRPSDQRTAATKAAGGEQQAAPTEKQEVAALQAELKQLREDINKKSTQEKLHIQEAEEKLHMIKAQTMRARTAQPCLRSTMHMPRAIHAPGDHARPAATRPARRVSQMKWSRTSTTAGASSSS